MKASATLAKVCRVCPIELIIITVSLANAQSTLALQEKCSKAAKEVFASQYQSPKDTCHSSYQSHYNRKSDKCFILVYSTCVKKEEEWQSVDLADVFEEKTYAYYTGAFSKNGVLNQRVCLLGDTQFNVLNGHEFNNQTKKWDIISEAYVKSLKEPFTDPVRTQFDNWVKPYMEE